VFNLTHDLKQMLWRRPHNRFEEANNLYIVGGGTHPGSGLPTIFESARISSKLVLDDLGIDPDWNGVDTWFEGVRRSPSGRKAVKQRTTKKESVTATKA
jgi:phytoene desaturase